jgi:V/A-type H+-transporting ATPase subunit B
LYAVYARGNEARLLAAIVGEAGLGPADRRALEFAAAFEREFVGQGTKRRTIAETLAVGWKLIDTLPREDLTRIRERTWAARRGEAIQS